MGDLIVSSIENQRRLRIWYNGGERIIEPHCFGEGRKGYDLLRAYQVSGHSESEQFEGWKLFIVEDVQNCADCGENFSGPRDGYNPDGDRAIPTVYAML